MFLELLGDINSLDILDLGCGDGWLGVDLLAAGCHSYLGFDASERMVHLAEANLLETPGRI